MVVREQEQILQNIASNVNQSLKSLIDSLESYDKLTTNSVNIINEFDAVNDTKNMIDFLFEATDSEEEIAQDLREKLDSIRTHMSVVFRFIEESIDQDIGKMETTLELEKQKDTSTEGTDAYVPELHEDDADDWKAGPYHQLLNDVLQLNASLDNESNAYWKKFVDEETKANDVHNRLVRLFEETTRMQRIRYNLWATRRLSNNTTYDMLALIDTGLLTSSVGALYSMKESELMQEGNPSQRSANVRKVLLRTKIGLNAF